MATGTQPSVDAGQTDKPAFVTRHKSYRGLTVEQNLLSQFTMYTVDLENFGLFISDSRPEAFNMAFEALYSGRPM